MFLEPLTEFEQQELDQIQEDFGHYFNAGKVSEGQIKFLVVAPLMRLAGFYRFPIQITLEENIETIVVQDEDVAIAGRLDILAVAQPRSNQRFWVLVIESKNSSIDVFVGLPQLLTYIYRQREQQASVWSLITNGRNYQILWFRGDRSYFRRLIEPLSFTNPVALRSPERAY